MDIERKSDEDLRRSSQRMRMEAMVTYRLDGKEYGNLAADISQDGIFIRTFIPPPVGTCLELTVRLPDDMGGYSVDLEGKVVRVVQGDDPRKNGMGVHFTAIHAKDPESVRHMVARIFQYNDLQNRMTTIQEE
jgi:hypothetical protein